MSGRGQRVDVRIAHTLAYLLRCPRSSVPEAMRACKFTLDESASRSKPQVRKSIDVNKEYALLVNLVQEVNEYAVYLLTEAGYNWSALQALVAIKPTKRRTAPITERMSQERIEFLARANTHGKKFFATGGSHVCSDDFF
jgi:hypothetical protein